jgi:hypothetical protein
MKKIIIIGVIVLFIGVGIKPALAVEPEVSNDNIENEEDCDCQEVSNSDFLKIKELLNELKDFTISVMMRFGHMPEVKEKCEELLDGINVEIPQDNEKLCNMFKFIIAITGILYLRFCFKEYQYQGTILEAIYSGIAIIFAYFFARSVNIYYDILKCEELLNEYDLGKLNEIKQILSNGHQLTSLPTI